MSPTIDALCSLNLSAERSGFDRTLADRNPLHLCGIQAEVILEAVRAGKVPGLRAAEKPEARSAMPAGFSGEQLEALCAKFADVRLGQQAWRKMTKFDRESYMDDMRTALEAVMIPQPPTSEGAVR